MVPLVLLPPAPKAAGGSGRAGAGLGMGLGQGGSAAVAERQQLDWGVVAEVLDGARAEGFSVVGVSAPCLYRSAVATVPELSRLLKLPASQAQALASAVPPQRPAPGSAPLSPPSSATGSSYAAAAGDGVAGTDAGAAVALPAAPLVALALARENAPAHLAMRLQASSGSGRGLGAAAGALAPVPSGRTACEQQLVQLFDVLSDSSGYVIARASGN